MSRHPEKMVEKVTQILPYHWRVNPPGGECGCGHVTPLGRMTSEHVAEAVLDAILPQVSTVAELEALPVETVVIDTYGRAFTRYKGWWDYAGEMYQPDELIGPLTVAWQP